MHPSTRNEVQTFRMNPDSGNGAVQNGAQGNQTNNLSYKNGVPAAEGAIKQQIECIAAICSDVDMVVTSTNENIPQHKPGTPHRRSEAADLRVPKGEENHVLVCSSACGGGFGLNERMHPSAHATGAHVHVQTGLGKGGGMGDAPILTPPSLAPELDGRDGMHQ